MMSPRMGRPIKGEQPRTGKITIRVSTAEAQQIQYCADALLMTRTDAIMAGIALLRATLDAAPPQQQ